MATALPNVTDISALYGPAYTCWLPQPVLEAHLNGTAFKGAAYTAEEKARGMEEIAAAGARLFTLAHQLPSGLPKIAHISAGAPGAGKTTVLNTLHAADHEGHMPYVDPDAKFLLESPWHQELKGEHPTSQSLTDAYTQLRCLSIAGTTILLAHVIKEGLPFYYGTTCQSDRTYLFFEHLRENMAIRFNYSRLNFG